MIDEGRTLNRHGVPQHELLTRCGRHRRLVGRSRSRAGWVVAILSLLCVTAYTGLGELATAPVRTTASVDFGSVVQSATPWSVGIGVSTYGATVLDSPVQARNERRLDAAMVRIPVSVRHGAVTSGAAGAGDIAVTALVARYRQWGYHVLVVIDGARDGAAVRPGDARTIIAKLGYDNGVEYSSANEPDNHGRDIDDAVRQARMIVAEGKKLYPDFKIWGPVWSSYDRQAFRTFAASLGNRLAGIDYHSYAMGQTSVSTAQAMRNAAEMETQVRQTRSDLADMGLHAKVSVDELNLTWRFQDGVPGGDTRLLTAVNTVWMASACGHVMLAGGSCIPYASQNGPLGMLTEPGQIPHDRQSSTPMPGYWGVAAWTGAGLFPHMGNKFFSVRCRVPGIEIYAVTNVAGRYNVIVIDTNQRPRSTAFALRLTNIAGGTYVPYSSDPARPFEALVAGPKQPFDSSISLVVRGMTVTTLSLTPDE